jgi:hypothetical protein
LCVLEERVGIVANESNLVETTGLDLLSEYIKHSRRLAGNWVVIVLEFIHFKNVHAPRVVYRKVDAGEAFIALAAEFYCGFAFKAHPDARQEPRDPLLLLLLSLLTALGVDAGNVLPEVAGVGKCGAAIGAFVRP